MQDTVAIVADIGYTCPNITTFLENDMTTPRNILRIITSGSFDRLSIANKEMVVKYCQHPENVEYLNLVSENMGGCLIPTDINFTAIQYLFVNICSQVDVENIDLIEKMFTFATLYRNQDSFNVSELEDTYNKMQETFVQKLTAEQLHKIVVFCYEWVNGFIDRKVLIQTFKQMHVEFDLFKKLAQENGLWVASMNVLGERY